MSDKFQTVNRLIEEAQRYIPVAQVSFHCEDNCYIVRGYQKDSNLAVLDPTDTLISITINKTMDAPAGTFTITLASDNWFTNGINGVGLKSNDLVVISMGYKTKGGLLTWVNGTKSNEDTDLDTVMIGLIDTVTCVRNAGGTGGAPSIQTTITGRDFGKIFLKTMLKFYPQLGATGTEGQKFFLTNTGWITLMKAFMSDNVIKGSPAKILDTILRAILTKLNNIKWRVYDTSTNNNGGGFGYTTVELGNMMQYVFAQTNFFIPFFMSAQQYEGSLWNLMSRVNLKPFTELFVDTRDKWEVGNTDGIPQLVNETVEEYSSDDKGSLSDGKWARPGTVIGGKGGSQVVLVYRNTPFDAEAWDKLRSHDIYSVDAIQETLSYSDNENYNLFWAGTTLTPFGNSFDLKQVNPPLINEANIERYGLSPLEVNIEGLELDKSQEGTQTIALEGLSSALTAKLKAWFENNATYMSGSITIRGKGDIKIGQKAKYNSREYYVEGVTQNFQVYGTWQTQLSVTRGVQVAPAISQQVLPFMPSGSTNELDSFSGTVSGGASSQSNEQVQSSYYTVTDTDTLWSIAAAQLGDGNRWTEIWELNKDTLIARDSRNASDPGHWIYGGMSLKLP